MKHGNYSSIIQKYKNIILYDDNLNLPGHDRLPLAIQSPRNITSPPPNARSASVVLMIHASDGVPSILFIQRANHFTQDKHRGQIAFPGGKQEKNESLKECAFREMEEEIGIQLPKDHPSRMLSPLYVSVSNFLIHPFVAFKDELPKLRINPEEVDSVINCPLIDLDNHYNLRKKDFLIRGQSIKNVPYFPIADKTLWGATALIFSELLHILRNHK